MKEDILNLTYDELKEFLSNLKEPKFRADQIFYELHLGKKISDISNIPKSLKDTLKDHFDDNVIKIIKVQTSSDGTLKFLYQLLDGNLVEGVLITYKFGNTLCVSSQVGCKMGCKFCASGKGGFIRNLTAGEMVGQVIVVNKYLKGTIKDRKIANIVFMGSGEVLDNYDNLLRFLDIITDKHGIYYSERNISVSTCGLVPKIYALADSKRKVNLCVSLHASNDNVRKLIMPIAGRYGMDEIIKACKYYFDKTGRRILFEYIMIRGVNSDLKYAKELAGKIKGLNAIVNLIHLSSVEENSYKECTPSEMKAFAKVLRDNKVQVTIRRSLGTDIDAGCGQLRSRFLGK